jgi:FKBP-type peptidyl-prolyl cis-trans isomerase
MNKRFKVSTAVLFAFLLVFGCKKESVTNSPENEASKIKGWLEMMVKNNNNIDTTSTGLYYIVDKTGTGPTVQAGDTVTVQYTAMFLDGTIFDSSASFTYVHKATGHRMIQGWEEGIEVMSKGGLDIFLIPSSKGYGDYGYSVIPPFTPLLFTIGITEIK